MSAVRSSSFFYSLKGVWVLLLTYGAIHGAMRLGASWNLGENDPASVVYTQSLAMLWASSDGVLFDFAFYGLSKILGVSAPTFQLLRYGLMALSLVFIYLITRRLSGDPLWSVVTVESYALIYQLSWRLHEGFTYPLVTMVMVAATFWSIIRLQERWSVFGLGIFIVFVGAGATTGLWFMGFLASLLVAFLFQRQMTGRWIIASILAVGVVASFGELIGLGFSTDQLVYSENPMTGIYEAALLVFAASSPFLILIALFFSWRLPHKKAQSSYEVRLIKHASLISFCGLLAIGLVLDLDVFGEHAVIPLFYLFPIWMMDIARRTRPPWWLIRLFIVMCLVLMAIAFLVRAANLYVLDPVCKRCYFGVPYQDLAHDLADYVPFDVDMVVLSPDMRLSGQLAAFWPGEKPWFAASLPSRSDVLRFRGRSGIDASSGLQKYLVVWNEVRGQTALRKLMARGGMNKSEMDKVIARAKTFSVGWHHWWRPTGYRKTVWKASLFERK